MKDQYDYANEVAQQLESRFKIGQQSADSGPWSTLASEERHWYLGAGVFAVQETIRAMVADGAVILQQLGPGAVAPNECGADVESSMFVPCRKPITGHIGLCSQHLSNLTG